MQTTRLATIAAALACLAAPAAAHAESIVYIDGGNVWSATPDGARKVQLTDGGDWHSPTQADDGTIAAVKGLTPDITVMARDGRVLHTITTDYQKSPDGSSFAPRPVQLSLSPDGSKLAYAYAAETCTGGSTCGVVETATMVTDTNVTTATPASTYGITTGVSSPEWASASRLLTSGGANIGIAYVDLGGDGRHPWIAPSKDVGDPELSRDGKVVVFTHEYGSRTHLYWGATGDDPRTAANPAVPAVACSSGNDERIADPSLSPDGLGTAVQDAAGIEVVRLGQVTPDGCGAVTSSVLTPTGSEPDWGPADPPAARAATASGAGPAGTGGGSAGGGRGPVGGDSLPRPATGTAIATARLKLADLRRGKARIRVSAASTGRIVVRVRAGRRTVATGSASATAGATVAVRLPKPTRKALRALRHRRTVTVSVTSAGTTVSRTVKVR